MATLQPPSFIAYTDYRQKNNLLGFEEFAPAPQNFAQVFKDRKEAIKIPKIVSPLKTLRICTYVHFQ